MSKLNIFSNNDNTEITTMTDSKKIKHIDIKDTIMSASYIGLEEKTVKTTVEKDNMEDAKELVLFNNLSLIAESDNKLFVSTEDDYESYKVVVLCCGKYQKIAYAQCPAHLFKSMYPEIDKAYIVYITPKEELAKFAADYFINKANLTEEHYAEAKKVIGKDGYVDFSFLQDNGINENYPDYDKDRLPMYIHFTTNCQLAKDYSVLIKINNYRKYENEINNLLDTLLDSVPYKKIDYHGDSCEIKLFSDNYEFILEIAKTVQYFGTKTIYPIVPLKESMIIKYGDTSKEYKKLPVSNICIGMTLPVIIKDEIMPVNIESANKYRPKTDDIFDTILKGKGLEIKDNHTYIINNVVVPDSRD